MLGVLIYVRLFNFSEMAKCEADSLNQIGTEQMCLNNKYCKGGLPVATENFLVYVTEWMMNVAAANKQTTQTTITHTMKNNNIDAR